MDPQELIGQIQRAGYSVTIDADPDGGFLAGMYSRPDASGMESMIAEATGRKLSAVLSKLVKAIPKPKPKRKKKT